VTPEQFLEVARVLPEPLCLVTGEGQILACNPPMEALLGLPGEALRGRSLLELTADAPEKVRQYLRLCSGSREMCLGSLTLGAGGGPPSTYRTEGAAVRPRSGDTPSLILLRLKPSESASGRFLLLNEKIDALAGEIRERRRAEEQAHEQHERLRVTLSSIGDAVITTDAEGYITFLNPVAEALTGWTQDEARGRPLEEVFRIISEETRLEVEAPTLKVLREGTIVGLANHTLLIARGGAEVPIDDSGAPIKDANGRIAGVVLVFRDVSERRRSEEAQARLGVIVSSSDDAIVSKTLDGIITSWNAGAERIFGYAAAEAVGRHISLIIPPDRLDEEADILARLRRGERIEPYETVRRRKDGRELAISLSISPVRDSAGRITGAAKIARDITGRKRAEAEREGLLAREQAARAAAEAAVRRAAFLARASEILASSLDYEVTLQSVARLAVPEHADWCTVDLTGPDGALQRVAVVHLDPAKIRLAEEYRRRYPPHPDDPGGVAKVLRTGEPEMYPEVSDEMLAQGARDAEQLEMLREVGLKSVIIVPLVARGRTLGAITLVTGKSSRRYSEADLAFARDLARRAALAVDNARLYREAQEALRERGLALDLHRGVEERLSVLIEASGRLFGPLHLDEVQAAILDLSGRLISADAYAVWRREPRNEAWQIATAVGLSVAFREEVIRAQDYAQSSAPARFEGALTVEDVKQAPWLAQRREAYRREGVESLMVIPLFLRGDFAGTIAFYYRRPHRFSEPEVRVATALANLSAAALDAVTLYAEQVRLRAEAEEASRLKDEFLTTVSHELRTPLNAILGWARLLRQGRLDAAQEGRAFETIERNARSQAQIVEDILDVSRIITGKLRLDLRAVDLPAVVRAAVESVRMTAEAKGVDLRSDDAADIGPAWADAERVQQIAWNLLSNAVKFTPPGGAVRVGVEGTDAEVIIVVSDTGQGISPEFLPYVFDRFSQADSSSTRKYGGLGLGLAIVRHLTELHGGSVRAESPGAGRGATFTVRLPRAGRRGEPSVPEEGRGAAGEEKVSVQPLPLEGTKVLVVDDEADARDLLETILGQYGARVRAAASAREALEALGEWGPDVLVADIGMPDEDGYMLIRQIRALPAAEGGNIPAAALTAYARSEDRRQALAAGYQLHVPKPVDPADLAAVVAELAARPPRADFNCI
jgi:PAS domain S-box-containing protein